MTIDLRPASSLEPAALADVFTRAYEGYFTPFHVDEALLRFLTETYDLDRDASRVAFDRGEAVGFGNLGLRGNQAWVGGLGVVASARRRGIGEAVMHALHEEARARGVTHVWLEVIEQNESAFALYEKLDYRVVRDLEVWSLPGGTADKGAREVPAEQAHARVRELRQTREPWQRADETLAHFDDLRGLETERGAAVFRVETVVQLLQIAGGELDALLRTLRGHGAVSVLNLPVDDPACEVLRNLGATVRVRQHEMVLELPSRG